MSVYNAYLLLHGAIEGSVKQNEPLSHHSAMRIGGACKLYVAPNTYDALVYTLRVLTKEQVPYVVLAQGTGILFSDEGYAGCVIELGKAFSHISIDASKDQVLLGAQAQIHRVIYELKKRSFDVLDAFLDIPGSVAGALVLDCKSSGESFRSFVKVISLVHPEQGLIKLSGDDVAQGKLDNALEEHAIIVEVLCLLKQGFEHESKSVHSFAQQASIKQTVGKPACGYISFGKRYIHEPLRLVCGDAQLNPYEPYCVLNMRQATARDVIDVFSQIHQYMKERYGTEPSIQIKLIGF